MVLEHRNVRGWDDPTQVGRRFEFCQVKVPGPLRRIEVAKVGQAVRMEYIFPMESM